MEQNLTNSKHNQWVNPTANNGEHERYQDGAPDFRNEGFHKL
jgi:hypothetical protein